MSMSPFSFISVCITYFLVLLFVHTHFELLWLLFMRRTWCPSLFGDFLCSKVYFIWCQYSHYCFSLINACMIHPFFFIHLLTTCLYYYIWSEFLIDSISSYDVFKSIVPIFFLVDVFISFIHNVTVHSLRLDLPFYFLFSVHICFFICFYFSCFCLLKCFSEYHFYFFSVFVYLSKLFQCLLQILLCIYTTYHSLLILSFYQFGWTIEILPPFPCLYRPLFRIVLNISSIDTYI